MRIASLHVYPIKSCGGVAVDALRLDAHGAVDDRRYMLVDPEGGFVSLRTEPRLATVELSLAGDAILASLPNGTTLTLPRTPDGARVPVRVWDDACTGVLQPDASRAFSDWLGRDVRLVGFPEDAPRPFTAAGRGPSPTLDFADAYPLLAISHASVREVCTAAEVPVDLRRFRPNVVFDGLEAFEEDTFAAFRLGALAFAAPKLCARCVAVDVDPARGVPDRRVLATLARTRKRAGKVWLGTNVVHLGVGSVCTSDEVVLTRRHDEPPLG